MSVNLKPVPFHRYGLYGFLLFFVPFVACLLLLLNHLQADIIFVGRQRAGLAYHQPVFQLMLQVQQYRSARYVTALGADQFGTTLQTAREQIAELIFKIDDRQATYGKLLGLTTEWPKLRQELSSAFLAETTGTPEEVRSYYTIMVRKIYYFSRRLADASNLILDPELNSYYLIDLAIRGIPELSEALALSRSRLSATLLRPANAEDIQQTLALLGRMSFAQDQFSYELSSAKHYNPSLRAALAKASDAAFTSLYNFEQRVTRAATTADKPILDQLNVQEVFENGTQTIMGFGQVYQVAYENLLSLLEARYQEMSWIRNKTLLLAGIVTLVAVLLVLIAQRNYLRRETTLSLAASNTALEQANHLKSDFLAMMSHEIRTPLHGVLGLADLLQEQPLNLTGQHQLQMLRQSGEILLALVNDILDLSKIESGRLALEKISFQLPKLLQDIVLLHQRAAQAKSLTLSLEVPANLPVYVMGDPTRLQQILNNYLSNAVKFTQHGQIQLTAACLDNATIRFTVADSGCGISSKNLEKLFQRFIQADQSTTRHYGGTGLGLVICKELAQLMGGQVGCSSELGRGSTFWCDLPLPAGVAPTENKDNNIYQQLMGRNVLVAEDNPVNQLLIGAMLEQLGCTYTLVSHGQAALEAAQTQRFDVILLDCQLPIMDGYQAATALSALMQQGIIPKIPIIAATAHVLDGEREKCLAAGMDDYLSKPLKLEKLAATLQRWLEPTQPFNLGAMPAIINTSTASQLGQLQQLLGQNYPDFLRRALADFTNKRQQLDTLAPTAALSLAELAHGLASVAAQLGFEPLAMLARRLEQQAREQPNSLNTNHLVRLQHELTQSLKQLQAALAAVTTTNHSV